MTQEQIHQKLLILISKERSLLSQIIDYLQMIYDQRIYAERGHSSLFAYVVKELGYSESAAYRRVNAVKMIKEIPGLADQVKSGALNLNTLADAASAFRRNEKQERKKLSPKEKARSLDSLVGKSKREAEKKLAKIFPQSETPKTTLRQFTTKQDDGVKTKVTLVFSEKQMKVIHRLKELYPGKDLTELFFIAGQDFLKRTDPMEKAQRIIQKKHIKEQVIEKIRDREEIQKNNISPGKVPVPKNNKVDQEIKRVPSNIKHKVWVRDKGECQFRNKKTGKICGSKMSLELDHLKPRAWGGEHSIDNIQLCCKVHNLYRAKKLLGDNKMRPYWK